MSTPQKSPPSYLSEPIVQYLSQVLEEIRIGNVLVPRFQREFVWNDDQRLDLLRSILSGIPIGSILVWRTTEHWLKTFPRIGPHKLPVHSEATTSPPRQYLLDGMQRMSTLMGALIKATPESGEKSDAFYGEGEDDEVRWDICYDLKENDFVFGNYGPEEQCIPTQSLLDSVSLLQAQRALNDQPNGDKLIRHADRVANAFRNYKIPVIPILGNNLEDATKAFQRINSTGTSMSDVHMVAALTFTKDFDLNIKLEELTASLEEVGWKELDRKYILATVRAARDLEISSPKAEQLSNIIKETPELLNEAVDNIKLAAQFLAEECNIPSPAFLPYSYQAVFLAEAYRSNRDPSDGVKRELWKWLWKTSYSGFFLGARSTQMINALDTIHAIASGYDGPFEPWDAVDVLPKKFDLHSARAKCLAVRMVELQARVEGSGNNALATLKRFGASAFPQLLTRAETGRVTSHLRGPQNRFLSSPETWLTERFVFMSGILTVEQHDLANAITPEARKALDQSRYWDFLSLRRQELIYLEKEFVETLSLKYSIGMEEQKAV